VDSGRIGKIIHYDHSENVSYYHFGHSFVRGNWKNKETSSPLILAKACHDLDLMYWILGEKPLTVQSSGCLTNYRPENAPEDAPARCTDGCSHSHSCPWFAPRLYVYGEPMVREAKLGANSFLKFFSNIAVNHRKVAQKLAKFIPSLRPAVDWKDWPTSVITTDLSVEGRLKALREGPYGKCIYKTGNDVVDHQVSTFQFPSGATGTLTLHGLSDLEGREIRIFGTKGTIRGIFRFIKEEVIVTEFRWLTPEIVHQKGLDTEGHGGGDEGLMHGFTSVLLKEKTPKEAGITDIQSAMESHYMAFAAEDARVSQNTLNLKDYR
jgi:predicted dehydrogenase